MAPHACGAFQFHVLLTLLVFSGSVSFIVDYILVATFIGSYLLDYTQKKDFSAIFVEISDKRLYICPRKIEKSTVKFI